VLPAAVQDPASAALGSDHVVLLGGLTAADSSTGAVTELRAGRVQRLSRLPGVQHDAQAAALGGAVFVFGGGDRQQYGHILRYDPASAAVTRAGNLPQAQSDVAVTQIGDTAYVVGGFNGTQFLDTILAWRPGQPVRTVAHLPVGVRYAAVAPSGGRVIIAGGSLPSGASSAIYRFDPATGAVARIGRLPRPLTHAGAAALGSQVYVVGGRGEATGTATSAIESIDPSSGAVHPAGRLPHALSDAAVVATGQSIVIAGGRSDTATQDSVDELIPKPGRAAAG